MCLYWTQFCYKGYNDKELYKICLEEEEEEDVSCNSTPLSNLTEVMQVMRSSWISRSHCVNVEVGQNLFVILPSVTDDYFTPVSELSLMRGKQDWPGLVHSTRLGRNNSPGRRGESCPARLTTTTRYSPGR